MNQETIKKAENVVKYALEIHADKQEQWDENIDVITKEAFTALRLKGFNETQQRNLQLTITHLEKKIVSMDSAMKNLRGYTQYLETRIDELEKRLEEET